MRVSRVSMAVNGTLAVVKLVAGIAGHSYALIADAVESLGDIVSSMIVWGGLVIAAKPADENHPYGHGKAEPLAALGVALMLIGSAVGIAVAAVGEIKVPHHAPAPFTLAVLLVVVGVKETMFRFGSRVAAAIDSTAIQVDAWHHRSDALTSLAAGLGIVVALIGGEGYESADDWAALTACVIIAVNGVRFARTALHELMDTTPEATMAERMSSTAEGVEGAQRVEKIFVRKMGPTLYVDLHLEVDPQLSVIKAHEIAHQVKNRVMEEWPAVADVMVHIEPFADADLDHE